MAERRMFAKTIIDSDAFLDMPLSTQALYFHLSMRGDDDGFINNPRKIQRMVGASDDDLKVLAMKNFIIPFASGIVVIKHWKIHNYIRGDRKKDTVYPEEMSQLIEKDNGAYTLKSEADCLTDKCPSTVRQVTDKCQHRLGKDSIGEYSLGQDSVVEGSVSAADGNGDGSVEKAVENYKSQLKLRGGSLGRGVVYLTDDQMEDLIDKLGIEAFDCYMVKLANFIIDNDAKIKNHYGTILKWWREDTAVEV